MGWPDVWDQRADSYSSVRASPLGYNINPDEASQWGLPGHFLKNFSPTMTSPPCSLHMPQGELLTTSHHAFDTVNFSTVCLLSLEFWPESVLIEWVHNRKLINAQTGTLWRHSRQPGGVSHRHQSGSRKRDPTVAIQEHNQAARTSSWTPKKYQDLIGKRRSQKVLLLTANHWCFSPLLEIWCVPATTSSASL